MNRFDDTQLYPLIIQNDLSSIRSFLNKYGLDSVDRDGRTFLTNLIVERKNEFAHALIAQGANVNQKDNQGATPLFAAIRSHNDEMIDELLSNPKVDYNSSDNYGRNALRIALQCYPLDHDLMMKLIKYGINPFEKDNSGLSPYLLMKKYQSGELTRGGNKIDFTEELKEIESLLHK